MQSDFIDRKDRIKRLKIGMKKKKVVRVELLILLGYAVAYLIAVLLAN